MVYCKGLCERFGEHKRVNGSPYGNGRRFCSICGVYMGSTNKGRCPCCNYLTRAATHKPTKAIRERKFAVMRYPEALETVKYSPQQLTTIENLRT